MNWRSFVASWKEIHSSTLIKRAFVISVPATLQAYKVTAVMARRNPDAFHLYRLIVLDVSLPALEREAAREAKVRLPLARGTLIWEIIVAVGRVGTVAPSYTDESLALATTLYNNCLQWLSMFREM